MTNKLLLLIATVSLLASCTTIKSSMKEPNTNIEFKREDFILSDQKTGEAKSVKIIGIDWARLFTTKEGIVEGGTSFSSMISLAALPVVGNYMADRTSNYALYEMMSTNPGYDVIFYPQYGTKVVKPFLGIGFITKITTVKATARLGKFSK